MRVPLRVGFYPEANVRIYEDVVNPFWQIKKGTVGFDNYMWCVYEQLPSDNAKFFENGVIYRADGSVADNEIQAKDIFVHGFRHVPLDDLLLHPTLNRVDNFLYGLNIGDYSILESVVAVRDRLGVPDWVALLIFTKIIDEDDIYSLLVNFPDLFEAYPVEWVLHVLSVSADDINAFGEFVDFFDVRDPNAFDNFCRIIELERQNVSWDLKIGLV